MSYSFKVTKVIKIEKVDGVKKDVTRQMIDVKTVAGHDYFGLSWQNRNVSLLFGKSSGRSVATKVSGGWPASVIGFIKRARNLATDKLISEHMKKNDPMAEFVTLDHMSPKDRTNAFHDAEVPALLNVEQLAFTTDDGDHVDAQTLNILSSPKTFSARLIVTKRCICSSMRTTSSGLVCSSIVEQIPTMPSSPMMTPTTRRREWSASSPCFHLV